MLKNNSTFRAEARQALRFNWTSAAITSFIFSLISALLNMIPHYTFLRYVNLTWLTISFIITGIVLMVLLWGFIVGFLKLLRRNAISMRYIFSGFNDFRRVFLTMLMGHIYIFLWSLLLVIPGIVKTYSYALTPYIMYDDPGTGYNAAIEKSMAMMKGHKMQMFLLDLSFIGWIILALIPLGFGMLWVAPYMQTARAAMYEDIKAQYTEVA